MIKKFFCKIIFPSIILLAIVLRFYQLGQNPPSLDWDEASIGYNAYSILKTGADEYGNFMPLSFRSFDDYKPPVYVYLTVPSIFLFGLTEFAVRLPAAIIGVIAVIGVYLFVMELLENRGTKQNTTQNNAKVIALLSAFFLAISPWHLQFSRAAFEGNIGLCFLILSLTFFFKGMQKSWYYLLFAAFFVLSMYSYHSFRLINPILIIVLIFLFFSELKRRALYFGIAVVIIILFCVPVYISFVQQGNTGARLSMVTIFSDPAIQKISAEQVAIAKRQHNIVNEILYNRRVIFLPEIIKGYLDHFNFDFLFLHGDGGVQHHAYNMGMLYLWDLPFILLGMFFLLKRRSRRIVLLFILFFLAPLPSAITTGTPQPVRAIAMIPAFQIFVAAGIGSILLVPLFNKKSHRRVQALITSGLCALLLLVNVGYYFFSYYIETPLKYGYFWQFGNKQAIGYAKLHESEFTHIFMSYAYDQPYIYYLFYNRIDPLWYQKHWNYSSTGNVDRFYRKIGKYEFLPITSKQFLEKDSLLIGTPAEIPDNIGSLKERIYFPDGRLAYKIVSI